MPCNLCYIYILISFKTDYILYRFAVNVFFYFLLLLLFFLLFFFSNYYYSYFFFYYYYYLIYFAFRYIRYNSGCDSGACVCVVRRLNVNV